MESVATVIFTTHNRCDILRQAIQAAQRQSVPIKILVMDDASDDGTQKMMLSEFFEVEYHRSEKNVGPCYHRNRGIELAKTEIVFPIDDDSILQSPYTIEQTLAEFDDARTGAVAIPIINILQNDVISCQAPDKSQIYIIHAFVAAAHAIRRSIFLKVGGYREFFFYMGEEGDLCIRLLQHRFFIRLGTADPIHHLQPPNRISIRADVYGRQNDVLFTYCNAPLKYLPLYLAGTSINGMIYGIKVGRIGNMLKGFMQGCTIASTSPEIRSPVDEACFNLYRLLKKHHFNGQHCTPLIEVESYF